MARYLAIEWDAQGLRVVEGTARGGRASVQAALEVPAPLTLSAAEAQAAGQRLKEALKATGIAAGPALVCLPRDRVVFRDVRYPDVPPQDAPDIVRFQAIKELTFPAEEAVLDYQPVSIPWPTGEQRALTVVARKEVLTAVKKLCLAAGLKLEGVSVRPFGVAANLLAQTEVPPSVGEVVAGVLLVNGTCELLVLRGTELLFSRSIGLNGHDVAGLAPELRRSLAAFSGHYAGQSPQRAFVAGGTGNGDLEALTAALRLPVFPYQVVTSGQVPAEKAPAFAGALGMLQERSVGKPAINLTDPKQPKPPSQRKKYYVGAGIVAAALLLIGLGITYGAVNSAKKSEIRELTELRAGLKKRVDSFASMEKSMEAINAWSDSEMVVLDELYNLIVHFPDEPGIRITKVSWSTLAAPVTAGQPSRQGASTKPAAAATPQGAKPIGVLTVEATGESPEALARLQAALKHDPHWTMQEWLPDTPGTNQARCILKVYRQLPHEYRLVLQPGENTTASSSGGGGERRRGGSGGGFGPPGGGFGPPGGGNSGERRGGFGPPGGGDRRPGGFGPPGGGSGGDRSRPGPSRPPEGGRP